MSANDNTSNQNTSTLKSYVDSATGAVQNLVGNLTGSTGDEVSTLQASHLYTLVLTPLQAQGKAKQNKADAEYDASHAAIKLPGATASSTGAVTRDDPDRTAGSWNQTAGSAKEFVGGALGSENLKQAGREQNRTGQEQEARGQVKDYTSGVGDRVSGAVGSAVAGLTGDASKQTEYQARHDVGKTQQRGAEHDILKEAEARRDI